MSAHPALGADEPDFFARVVVLDRRRGCWIWRGRSDADGYGLEGGERAHRLFFELEHGEGAADGLEVHHECERRSCVNPAHLVAMTTSEHAAWHHRLRRELQDNPGVQLDLGDAVT